MHTLRIRPFPAVLVAFAAALAACGESAPRTEPEGGFEAFAFAVTSSSPASLWETLSEANRQRVADGLQQIRDLERVLMRLQPSERAAYREQAGLVFAESLQTPYDLFVHLVSRANFSQGESVLRGLAVDTITPLDGSSASVVTAAEETFVVVLEEDGLWRVESPMDGWIERSFEDLRTSTSNLRQTVDLFGSSTNELDELRTLGFLPPAPSDPGPTP